MYEAFKADCKREMYLRKWGNKELAKATGCATSTINRFFSKDKNRDESENVAKAISAVLGIEM